MSPEIKGPLLFSEPQELLSWLRVVRVPLSSHASLFLLRFFFYFCLQCPFINLSFKEILSNSTKTECDCPMDGEKKYGHTRKTPSLI